MPSPNTKYVLDNYCESPLLPHEIPNDVTHVYINKYNYPIIDDIWPDSVTHLIITQYNYQIHVLPKNLVVFKIENPYEYVLPELPNSLKVLELFSYNFVRSCYENVGYISRALETINHDVKLPDLPNGLETLHMHGYYDHELVLPASLKNLYLFGCSKKLSALPNGLQHLKIMNDYIHNIDVFPDSLISLEFGFQYRYPINALPKNLEILRFRNYEHELPKLPSNLKILEIIYKYKYEFSELPANLRILTLSEAYNHKFPKLPALTKLKLGHCYNQELPELPANLRILELGHNYDRQLPKLPATLTTLKLGHCYNQELPKLPANLRILELGHNYDRQLPKLPINLEYLHLRCKNSADMILPIDLKCIVLYSDCMAKIYENTEVYCSTYAKLNGEFIYDKDLHQIDGENYRKILNYSKLKIPVSEISIQQRLDALECKVQNILDNMNHL